jgi:polyisoprenoid-binding protein YceI
MRQNLIFSNWPLAILILSSFWPLSAQSHPIDTVHSEMTVRVYKAGVLSAFGHDHEISAPIAGGSVDASQHKVELYIRTGALRVQDAKASEKDRAEIQATMVGPEVLDAGNYNEIRFHSTSVQAAGAGAWKVSGELRLHGETRPVSMEVRGDSGEYKGICRLNITDFGIKPVKAAGGAVRVKDQVQIDFVIRLAH